MNSAMSRMSEWVHTADYGVYVHSPLKDSVVYDSGLTEPKNVRSVRLLVEYANHSTDSLKFCLDQWLLFDTEGFSYEFELRNQFYEDDAPRKLKMGMISPGQQVKGWVAFQLPTEAQFSYVQFRANPTTHHIVNIRLLASGEAER